MERRRLFKNEIGVNPDNEEQMQVLAEILEIEADGGDSGSDFVSFAIKKMDAEISARRAERRAAEYRSRVVEMDGVSARKEGTGDE